MYNSITKRCIYSSATAWKHTIRSTTRISISETPDQLLTSDDLEIINSLPFFKQSNISSVQYTKKKKEFLDEKFHVVESIFGIDPENPPFIHHNPTNSTLSPYESSKRKRLSVTKLITKSWCELRVAYDTYSQFDQMATPSISKGVNFHKSLEQKLYPTNETLNKFIMDQNIQSYRSSLHYDWHDTTRKLIYLFSNGGECREVLCHAWLYNDPDPKIQSGAFVKNITRDGHNLILVSGIIDHLSWHLKDNLEKRVTTKTTQFNLFNDVFESQDIMSDIDKVFNELNVLIPQRTKDWEILTSDVKTRSTFTIPKQTSVLKGTKLQIMYYKHFLSELGNDQEQTYEKLLLNAKKRGLDVDEPINPLHLIALLIDTPFLLPDMKRLRDGECIGFAPFDSYINNNNNSYNLTDLSQQIIDNNIKEQYQEFFTGWKIPVTLRYFAARLSQFYSLPHNLISNKLSVEYYCNGTNFHNILFDYDRTDLEYYAKDASLFWFGKRQIEPIEPTVRNFLTYCKYCDYESVCSWKNKGEQGCKQIGANLVNLFK